jgi:hypothetical protein
MNIRLQAAHFSLSSDEHQIAGSILQPGAEIDIEMHMQTDVGDTCIEMKNAVFGDVMPGDSCKNRRFGGM